MFWRLRFPFLPGSRSLQQCGPVTCAHAVAVQCRAYDRILTDIPDQPAELERWLADWLACDQYLHRQIADAPSRRSSPRRVWHRSHRCWRTRPQTSSWRGVM
jgi:hypothetical protein